jgi:hypothetical protein
MTAQPPPPPPAPPRGEPTTATPWYRTRFAYGLGAVVAVLLVVGALTSPAEEPGAAPVDETDPETTTEEAVQTETDDVAETEEAATEELETDPEEAASEEPEPASDDLAAYTSIYLQGVEPALDSTEGEVTVAAIAPIDGSGSFPMIVHNGTDEPISRVEVSAAAVDADGTTLSSGKSQGFEPNLIEPDGIGFGYVFAARDLPAEVTLDQISVDYTTGVGRFENIVAVDVTEVTLSEERATGTITNPHDVEISGPISVDLACLDDGGSLTATLGSYADRDSIGVGETSTFTIDYYGRTSGCAGVIMAASGFGAR